MRPNYAQDAPPTEISVGGFAYPANVDYRVWIDVLRLLREIDLNAEDAQQKCRTMETIDEIERLVFGDVLVDESPADALLAILEFSRGYPSAPMEPERGGPQTYSFDYDLNEIIIAIRNQSGIDLSYRRKEPFHWWEFLLEFKTLCGNIHCCFCSAVDAADSAGCENFYSGHCGNNHCGSNGCCAVHSFCGKHRKIAAACFCNFCTFFTEIFDFFVGKADFELAADYCDCCGDCSFGTDDFFNVPCGIYVLGIGHTVADDGGFQSDDGSSVFKGAFDFRCNFKIKFLFHNFKVSSNP